MLISDMKVMRSFHSHKSLFLLNPTKTPKSLSLLNPQSHFTTLHFHSQESNFAFDSSKSQSNSAETRNSGDSKDAPRVWSIYSPVLSKIETQRNVKKSDEQEMEPGLSSFNEEIDDLKRDRIYESAKKRNLIEGEETHAGLSSFDKEFDDLLKEKGYGGLKKENLSDRDKAQMGILGFHSANKDLLKQKSYGGVNEKNLGDGDKIRMGLLNYNNQNGDLMNENRNGGMKKVDSVNGVELGDIVRTKKKGKSKISWVCESCGYTDGQWWGYCRECGKAGTMKQFSEAEVRGGSKVSGSEVSENMVRSWLPQQAGELQPLRLMDVNRGINHQDWRIPLSGLFGIEVARVLGGGIVPGSLVLVGGDPGVGKSTLLLQIAATIAEEQCFGKPASVVYVSGEESVEQIGNRADRMRIGTENLFLYSSTDIEDILGKIQRLSPRALIVDSIQTVYLNGIAGGAGGIYQVKECTSALLRFAKKTNIPVLVIGHVTKSGDIAGPRVLEHIVDVVLYMEGEKYSSHRLLRPVKNRFGSTDELGVFEMSQMGLQAVSNPSEMFLSEQHSESDFAVGLAIAVIMDGSRTFLVEIQALCVSDSSVSRQINGIQENRADMIISVLIKQAGLMLQKNAVFLNVVSGVKLADTAGDLAIAAAICSSFLELALPNNVAFIGEIGLAGELRAVPRMEKRVSTVVKLGYNMCVVPKSAENSLASIGLEGMKIIGCKNLKEVINTVFTAKK